MNSPIGRIHFPLLAAFVEKRLDVRHLLQEITLREAELVRRDRGGERIDAEVVDLEKKVLEIIRYFCTLVLTRQFTPKLSRTTCVSFWNHIWMVLFGDTDVCFDIGELASPSTRADMRANELLFGTLFQSGGRRRTPWCVRSK
ncbi:hypothetical protein BGZ98_002782 [Dissophora globulifera]|nr:hypothetical protein BGZ98_002782 [Dissophora globulifera]